MANEATYSQPQVDALVEAAVSKANDDNAADAVKVTEDATKVIEAKDAEIAELTEAKDKAEANLKDYVKATDEAEVVALIEAAIDEGKVLPAEKDKYLALASVEATVKMGEDELTPRQILESIFKDLPKKVDLSENTNTDDPLKDVGDEGTAGEVVNAKARALQAQTDGLSYSDAYSQVLASDPDLKERYFKLED